MLSDGPEVSLNGSPTVSPTTAALWASEPLPPKLPASIYFLAHTMNERYILPLLGILPFAYARHKDVRLLFIMTFITFTATIDQMLFLFDIFGGRMFEFRLFAGLNFACYIYFVYVVLDIIFEFNLKEKLSPNPS